MEDYMIQMIARQVVTAIVFCIGAYYAYKAFKPKDGNTKTF